MDTKVSALFTLETRTTFSMPILSWWVKMAFGAHILLENMNYVSVK